MVRRSCRERFGVVGQDGIAKVAGLEQVAVAAQLGGSAGHHELAVVEHVGAVRRAGGGAKMDAATSIILDETSDLQEQVRTLNLSDGEHPVASYQGVAVAARIKNGKVVEYIANDRALSQAQAARSDS